MRHQHYIYVTYKITPEEDGGFTAICEELGTASCGVTVDEAVKNIKDAVLCDLNTLEQFNERERFFKKRGIKMYKKEVKSSGKPVYPRTGEYISRHNIPVCV